MQCRACRFTQEVKMSHRSISGWFVAVVFLGVLVGIAGGGLMGGVAGYYVAENRAPASLPPATSQLAAVQPQSQSPAASSLTVTENSAVIDVANKAEPAVVTIVNTLQSRPRRSGRGSGANVAEGSGIIIDRQGHIVTNAHVVDGAQQIDVIFADGTQTSAKLVGADSSSDVAVLQVTASVPGVLTFGDSNALQLGETVIAIGSPLGSYRGSVTSGVVSGLNRSVQDTGETGLIQTDAAINHGNSGGPLLNLAGQVIGINTLVVQNSDSGDLAQGLGFAIPSNTVSAIVKQLIAQH
jgi:2-alkenal reductase